MDLIVQKWLENVSEEVNIDFLRKKREELGLDPNYIHQGKWKIQFRTLDTIRKERKEIEENNVEFLKSKISKEMIMNYLLTTL